jgi:DMSO/TMAO reductase YedYZ heme-binding membrane subunit
MRGWPIVGWAALAIVAASAAVLAAHGTGEAGVRAVVRLTARTSFVLFTAAFVAAAVARRWPGGLTGWMLANRRQLGVSFAVSHLVHLVAILALARFTTEFLDASLLIAVVGYAFIAAMAATSFDRTAAWLGPRRWRRLHVTGVWYLWFVFLASYLPRTILESWAYAPFVVVLGAALALRLTTPPRAAAAAGAREPAPPRRAGGART